MSAAKPGVSALVPTIRAALGRLVVAASAAAFLVIEAAPRIRM